MRHLLLLLGAFAAVYSVASIAILIVVGVRWAWGMLPLNPEVVARQRQMDRDRELVRLGKDQPDVL